MSKTIAGLITFIIFYYLGTWTQNTLQLPIPGSVFGLCYLFIYLVIRHKAPAHIQSGSKFLIDNLTLWLIPGCVGVMTCFSLVSQDTLAILLTLSTGIPLTIILSALLIHRSMSAARRKSQCHIANQ